MTDTLAREEWLAALTEEERATLKAADLNKLNDSDFAYIDTDGGRHLPIHDDAHVKAALARFNQTQFESDAAKTAAAKKIVAKAKSFGVKVSADTPVGQAAGLKESKSALPAVPRWSWASVREWQPPTASDVQVRMADDSSAALFVGYASRTETAYDVTDWLGAYSETIRAGAFAKTLRESDNVPLLVNHDGMPLASTASKTSRLAEDGQGLRNEADLDRRQALTNDICIALERGDMSKMSFSFSAVRQDWNEDYSVRGVSELRLYDTSIVTYPANPTTTAGLRSEMRDAMGREGVGLFWSLRGALAQVAEKRELPADAEPVVEAAIKALRSADDVMVKHFGCQGRGRTVLVADVLNRLLTEVREGATLAPEDEALLVQAMGALDGTEGRATPKAADLKVSAALTDLHNAYVTALAAQAADPDNNTDPDDKAVSTALKAVGAGISAAIEAQAKDGAPDAPAEGEPANKTGADAAGQTTGGGPSGAGLTSGNPTDGAGPRSVPKSVAETRDILRKLRRGW